jgi:hypothetical protein
MLENPMKNWHARLMTAMAVFLILGGCSVFDTKNTNPYCGESVKYQTVELVDLTSFEDAEDRLDSLLRSKFDNYRLMTEKPLQIPRDYVYWNRKNIKGISGAKSEAASWGCNLLVLMEAKAARSGVGVQARNEDIVWMVHVGTVNTPR